MKILSRNKFLPISLLPGDILKLTWTDQNTHAVLTEHMVTAEEAMTFDEGILFDTIIEDRRAIGGAVLERKEQP